MCTTKVKHQAAMTKKTNDWNAKLDMAKSKVAETHQRKEEQWMKVSKELRARNREQLANARANGKMLKAAQAVVELDVQS